jgi:hypothetical protein
MAVLAPMPMANVSRTVRVKPGFRVSMRRLKRMSFTAITRVQIPLGTPI